MEFYDKIKMFALLCYLQATAKKWLWAKAALIPAILLQIIVAIYPFSQTNIPKSILIKKLFLMNLR
jgi:hypothetical protein